MDFITNIPKALLKLDNPPKKLYYKGNTELLKYKKIAIVGSRKCTTYTKNLIFSLGATLKNHGICVVSGAALGADIFAHQASLPNTIAVFGNGLDVIYPRSNDKTIKEIYKNSLALSEYEPDQKPHRASFLERNRIVVALSDALVVAQADIKSGSMSSARIASKLGIPVYVFPQRFGESLGTNKLLEEGKARLLIDFEEFASKFEDENYQEDLANTNDELLEFVKYHSDFDECYEKFGDEIYEYELDGKIAIDGVFVRLL